MGLLIPKWEKYMRQTTLVANPHRKESSCLTEQKPNRGGFRNKNLSCSFHTTAAAPLYAIFILVGGGLNLFNPRSMHTHAYSHQYTGEFSSCLSLFSHFRFCFTWPRAAASSSSRSIRYLLSHAYTYQEEPKAFVRFRSVFVGFPPSRVASRYFCFYSGKFIFLISSICFMGRLFFSLPFEFYPGSSREKM